MVIWYWQEKTEELKEKPVPVSLCPPQVLRALTQVQTQVFAVRGRQLTAWAIAQPYLGVTLIHNKTL
jgi:hypothetical protein